MATTSPNGIYYHTTANAPITEEARSLAVANSVQTAITNHTHATSAITSGQLDAGRMTPGSVVQVQSYYDNTYTAGSSSSWTDVYSGLRLNFTPKLTNSNIFVLASMSWLNEGNVRRQVLRLVKDGSNVVAPSDIAWATAFTGWTMFNGFYQWKDTWGHTAGTQISYSFQTAVSSGTWYYNYSWSSVPGISMFTVWEVAT